jgi:NAD(P)-dependent dehydrogenase (short-subunit alcohol dehydrogenase family)
MKKIVFISGATKGIGSEVAIRLASQDFTVLIGARNIQQGEVAVDKLRLHGADAHFIPLDVNDELSVKSAAELIAKQFGKVDVLINNAGVNYEFQSATRPSMLSVDILKDTFGANFFGAFAIIHYFLPLLKQAGAALIINVSSTLGSLTCLSDPENFFYRVNSLAYNSSKTALNALTVSLAKDLADDNISVNSICPGWVKTDMGTDAAPRTVQQGAAIIVKMATMDNSPTGKFFDDNGEIPW